MKVEIPLDSSTFTSLDNFPLDQLQFVNVVLSANVGSSDQRSVRIDDLRLEGPGAPPQIVQLAPDTESPSLEAEQPTSFNVQVLNRDNDPLVYTWSSTCPGTFQDNDTAAPTFHPGRSMDSQCTIAVKVTDNNPIGGFDYGEITLSKKEQNNPDIQIIDNFQTNNNSWTIFGENVPDLDISFGNAAGPNSANAFRLSAGRVFSGGFGVVAAKRFNAAPLDASAFSSIAFWVKSRSEDSARTLHVELIADRNGQDVTHLQRTNLRPILTDLAHSWVKFEVPFTTGFNTQPSLDDLANIKGIQIVLLRNNTTSSGRAVLIDDLRLER